MGLVLSDVYGTMAIKGFMKERLGQARRVNG